MFWMVQPYRENNLIDGSSIEDSQNSHKSSFSETEVVWVSFKGFLRFSDLRKNILKYIFRTERLVKIYLDTGTDCNPGNLWSSYQDLLTGKPDHHPPGRTLWHRIASLASIFRIRQTNKSELKTLAWFISTLMLKLLVLLNPRLF